jgi:hypothetical protein
MSFEEIIISEKYFNIIQEKNKTDNLKYMETRFNLLVKYILNNPLNHHAIGDSYFKNIYNTDLTPFIIKTNLHDELNELNINFNHYKLTEFIKEIKNEYQADLKEEKDLRSLMDEGQILERNEKMLTDFINYYGYNPFNKMKTILEEDEQEQEPDQREIKEKTPETNKKEKKEKKDKKDKKDKIDQNGSLESLNKILEIISINFKDINKDLKSDNMIDKEEIKKLTNDAINKHCTDSILKLANHYQNDLVLHKSTFKANLLYLYLIKNHNIPEAMYLLGSALISGEGIMKNHLQGAKLIKIAAEDYKYSKAITKMKTLQRQIIKDNKDYVSESEED